MKERLSLLPLARREIDHDQPVHRQVARAMRGRLLQAALEGFPRRLEILHLETVPPDDREHLTQSLRVGAYVARRESLLEELGAHLEKLHSVIGEPDFAQRLGVPPVCGETRLPGPELGEIGRHGLQKIQMLVDAAEPFPTRELRAPWIAYH